MNTFEFTMKWQFFLILPLLAFAITACEKEEDEEAGSSNLSNAPAIVDQEFAIEFIEEQDRIIEKTVRTGLTEIAKTTYKFDNDTIVETFFELRQRRMVRRHVLVGGLPQFTIDTTFGPDTIQYYRIINYFYNGADMEKRVVEHFDVYEDSVSYRTYEHAYTYANGNLDYIGYSSSSPSDSLGCFDRYEYYNLSAKHDVTNLLGTEEGSISKNLKSGIKQLVACNGNGNNGSTQYEYWYELDSDERITEMVYRKTFGPTSQSFRETYTYLSR